MEKQPHRALFVSKKAVLHRSTLPKLVVCTKGGGVGGVIGLSSSSLSWTTVITEESQRLLDSDRQVPSKRFVLVYIELGTALFTPASPLSHAQIATGSNFKLICKCWDVV